MLYISQTKASNSAYCTSGKFYSFAVLPTLTESKFSTLRIVYKNIYYKNLIAKLKCKIFYLHYQILGQD